MGDYADYYLKQYQHALDEHQQCLQQQQQYNMQQQYHINLQQHQHNMQQYQNLTSGYGCSGYNGYNSFNSYNGCNGYNDYNGYNGYSSYNGSEGMGNYAAGTSHSGSRTGNLDAGMDNFQDPKGNEDSDSKRQGTNEREFVYYGGKSGDKDALKFSDRNSEGGRVVISIPGATNISILNGIMYVNGAPAACATKIPKFTEHVQQQFDGRQVLELELDTSRFNENQIEVIPSVKSVIVHIEHSEKLANGSDMMQSFDIPHRLPKADPEHGGLVTYFSDGKLTIEAPMAS